MNKSRILKQDKIYVRFDKSGTTSIVPSKQIIKGYSYRRVHDTHEAQKTFKRIILGTMFQDKQYMVRKQQLVNLDPEYRRVTIRRLSDLIKNNSKSIKAYFFPPPNYLPPRKLSRSPLLPPFSTQLGVFPVQYYKTFFITQDFSKEGLYQMIINQKGRFQTDVVDDFIAVYEDSLEPIWGMELDQCWQIILLKFWAKKCGGYDKVKTTPPYVFLQYFSNSNWKYFNLYREGFNFLTRYAGKTGKAKIIIKTKNSLQIYNSGLIANSAGYQIISLDQVPNEGFNPQNQAQQQDIRNRRFVATVRSTMNNQWSGKMSVIDPQINKRYFPQQYSMSLQRDFMINQFDLLNLFSSAYVSSRRDEKEQDYISDYYSFKVQPNNKKSIYIKFDIPERGWFDFCIKQFQDNRVKILNAASQIRFDQFNTSEGITGDGTRYLKIKYILVKLNNIESPSTFQDWDYQAPQYDTYQIQYSHGYNRGDARFLDIVPGTYILKIKPQTANKPTYFTVNYASNSLITMEEYFPTKQQSSLILRQAMSSLIGIVSHYHLDKNIKYEQICFSNTFEEIGYGFVGIRSKKSCPYQILIEVDPNLVRNSGYKIKNQFKNINQPFSISIRPGECTSIVLKKAEGTSYEWPPKGIEIFKQKL